MTSKVLDRWRYTIFTSDGSVPFLLSPVQQALNETTTNINIILKSRQLGITSFCVLKAIDAIIYKPGRVSLIVCPSESQVKTIIGYVEQIISTSGLKGIYADKQYSLQYSGKIVFTNSNTDSCRGIASDYIYVTEAQDYADIQKVLDGILPTVVTRPNAKIYVDGTMPLKGDNSFLRMFGDVLKFIPEALEKNIVKEGNMWILFNPDITREQVGESYNREVLLELPMMGARHETIAGIETKTTKYLQAYFVFRGNIYRADYATDYFLTTSATPLTIQEVIKEIALDRYTTYVDVDIAKAIPAKYSRMIAPLDEMLGTSNSRADQIYTSAPVDFYLDGEQGGAFSLLGKAALVVNAALDQEQR